MSNKQPDFNQLATTSWDTNFDVDSIINEETQKMALSVDNPGATHTPTYSNQEGLQVQVPAHLTNNSNTNNSYSSNTPATQQNSNVPTFTPDPFKQNMESILDEEVGQDTSLLAPVRDSGTQTPQQGSNQYNQQQAPGSQQQLVDNNPQAAEDPYILAFKTLEDFDFIRLPENVDYSKLDVNTLEMYKMETLDQQRNEALDYVRAQVAHDPLMSRLLDYGYYGSSFADLPKMQTTLKKVFDFSTYNTGSEKAQKAIVRLYYSDGLNQADSRDRKIISNIPTEIKKLSEDLKLKEEAELAKRFFVERANKEADVEEARVMQLMQEEQYLAEQDSIEQELWDNEFRNLLDSRDWSPAKKVAIVDEAVPIQLEDGSYVPLWQYKQEIILNNPELFQQFLDFTSKFDLDLGNFVGGSEQPEQLSQNTLSKIVQRLESKSNNSKGTRNRNNVVNPNTTKKPRVVDVKKGWF